MSNPFIAHYGKRGMHWGVRNRRKVTKLGPSKDTKRVLATVNKAKTHSVASLTNQELKDFNSRVDLERKFTSANPKKIQKGHEAVKRILAVGVTVNSALLFAKSPAGKFVANMLSGNSNSMKEYDVLLKR